MRLSFFFGEPTDEEDEEAVSEDPDEYYVTVRVGSTAEIAAL